MHQHNKLISCASAMNKSRHSAQTRTLKHIHKHQPSNANKPDLYLKSAVQTTISRSRLHNKLTGAGPPSSMTGRHEAMVAEVVGGGERSEPPPTPCRNLELNRTRRPLGPRRAAAGALAATQDEKRYPPPHLDSRFANAGSTSSTTSRHKSRFAEVVRDGEPICIKKAQCKQQFHAHTYTTN